MLKLPITDIILDIDNIELNEKYINLLKQTGIKELYFAGDIKGLMELSNSKFFKLIPMKNDKDDLYYCSELSIYFKRSNNLSTIDSRSAVFEGYSNKEKYAQYFDICKEIVEEDRNISSYKKLVLQNKKSQ